MTRSDQTARLGPAARRWPAMLLGVALGAGGVLSTQQWFAESDRDDSANGEVVALATVAVSTADLVEEVEWEGTLGYTGQTAVNRVSGTVTAVVEPGTLLERGDAIVEVDARPQVVFYGEVPFYRSMEQDIEGPDVFELESNLAVLGFDPDATVTIDTTFTYNTELMVQRWQEALGVEATGIVEASDAIMLAGPVVTLDVPAVGASASGLLVTLAPQSELVVTVAVAVSDSDEWAVDDSVTVVLADESERDGFVRSIGTELTTDQNGSTIDVSVELSGDTMGLLEGPVTVRTIGEEVLGAIVVPTRALVALSEGGFAVEVANDNGTARLVGIEIGAFDDGLVELTVGDVRPGDLVVVPQ